MALIIRIFRMFTSGNCLVRSGRLLYIVPVLPEYGGVLAVPAEFLHESLGVSWDEISS